MIFKICEVKKTLGESFEFQNSWLEIQNHSFDVPEMALKAPRPKIIKNENGMMPLGAFLGRRAPDDFQDFGGQKNLGGKF